MAILLPLKIQEMKIEPSRFRLAQTVFQRAKMLLRGARPLVDTPFSKPITIALQEVLDGKVSYYDREEAEEIREALAGRLKEQEEAEVKAIQEKEAGRGKSARKARAAQEEGDAEETEAAAEEDEADE